MTTASTLLEPRTRNRSRRTSSPNEEAAEPPSCGSEQPRSEQPHITSFVVIAVHLRGSLSYTVPAAFQQAYVVVSFAEMEAASAARSADRLTAAVVRVQLAMAVTQVDTEGRRLLPPTVVWDELTRLARPLIRAAVRACRVPREELEDCVQEAWLEVVRGVRQVDPNPARGSLAGWMQTIAHRTTRRLLRNRLRAAAVAPAPLGLAHCVSDPRQPDPAELCAAAEAEATLTELLGALRISVGDDAYCIVDRFLAPDAPRRNALAPELGLTSGQFWHQWRKVVAFLRERLSEDT